jgi:hypothetical protein
MLRQPGGADEFTKTYGLAYIHGCYYGSWYQAVLSSKISKDSNILKLENQFETCYKLTPVNAANARVSVGGGWTKEVRVSVCMPHSGLCTSHD